MPKPKLRQRFFAWLLKKGESVNERIYRSIKQELFKDLSGLVVEIGPGTGINFNYFPRNIDWIGLEPNEAFHDIILQKASEKDIKARLIKSVAEKIDLPDESADAVISTLVLCSVRDLQASLQEIKRVLKKEGKLFIIEHVAALPGSMLRKTQKVFNPVNRLIADGCNCNRETWKDIEFAGFSSVHIHHERIKGTIFLHAPHIIGFAIK